MSDKIKVLGGEHWGCEWQARFDALYQDPQFRELISEVTAAIGDAVLYARAAGAPALFIFQPHPPETHSIIATIAYGPIEDPRHH